MGDAAFIPAVDNEGVLESKFGAGVRGGSHEYHKSLQRVLLTFFWLNISCNVSRLSFEDYGRDIPSRGVDLFHLRQRETLSSEGMRGFVVAA